MAPKRNNKRSQTNDGHKQPLKNPTSPENWPTDPSNTAELDTWIKQTREALLKWMTDAQKRAEDGASSKQISKAADRTRSLWREFEELVDMQTGTIFGRSEREKMLTAMDKEITSRQKLHKRLDTFPRHTEYTEAQTAWEDFLYYQNEWNRKYFDPGQDFFLSKADRDIAEAVQRAKAGQKKVNTEQDQSKEAEIVASNDQQSNTSSADPSWEKKAIASAYLEDSYLQWRNHMIELFNRFELGSRDNVARVVRPQIAHRYSQPTRGTINQSFERGQQRFNHLEARFPRVKRKQLAGAETARRSKKRSQDQHDNSSSVDEWEPIDWQIDDEACKQLRMKREKKYLKDPLTETLLPKEHILHHGCLENSFDWPTSFDSPLWGDFVSVTASRLGYVYEKVGGAKNIPIEEQKYKRDADGKKIIKMDTRPTYQMRINKMPSRVFIYDRDDEGKVIGRDREGKWKGHWADSEVDEEEFEIQGRNKRILLPPRPCITREFKTVIIRVGDRLSFQKLDIRPDRPEEGGKGMELSEDEAGDCVKSNLNFQWSGTNNPSQARTRSEVGKSGNDEDVGSSDEGDLFTSSYKKSPNVLKSEDTENTPAEAPEDTEATPVKTG